MSLPDDDTCYRAVCSRDTRFDGWFFTAVRSTGIYCRPSCPATTPLRRNVDFFPSAASAQHAGFRACKRCRPDASPGSAQWNMRGDLAARAMRLIGDGLIDREGVTGLARQLGYSQRQLHRALNAELGVGPLALARAQRAQTARILLENSAFSVSDVAFAAGFGSVRQFNDTVQQIFACTPSQLRARSHPQPDVRPDVSVSLRLAYRTPMTLKRTLDYLSARAIDGVERIGNGYRRTVRLPHGFGLANLRDGPGYVGCDVSLQDQRDLVAMVSRLRRLLDLDADPEAVDAHLAGNGFSELVRRRPGLRAPGTVDGFELAVRAIVGQQVSVASARRVLTRIAESTMARYQDLLVFPDAVTLAALTEAELPLPARRAAAIRGLAAAVVDGTIDLHPGADRLQVREKLLHIPGIGAWTADYIVMRALGDPDIYLDSDLVVARTAKRWGIPQRDFSPWGSYASHQLWAASAETPIPARTEPLAAGSSSTKTTSLRTTSPRKTRP